MRRSGNGSYRVLKEGYKHERHVFPGGRIDADAIARLLTTDAKPEPPAGTQWRLAQDGSHRYEPHGDSDASSAESQRALFGLMRTDLEGTEDTARAIAAANQEAIMALPDKGRDALLAIIERRGLGS